MNETNLTATTTIRISQLEKEKLKVLNKLGINISELLRGAIEDAYNQQLGTVTK